MIPVVFLYRMRRVDCPNAGKGGDNATSALARLEKDVLAHHPDIVTVSWGLNDTGSRKFKDKEFCEKMRSLADGKEVLLCDLPTIFKDAFKQDSDLIKKAICPDGVHLTAERNGSSRVAVSRNRRSPT